MSDETSKPASDPTTSEPPVSGNRWEPSGSGHDPADPVDPVDSAQASTPSRRGRSRVGVAAVAVAGLVVAGVGGFAAGRVTAGDGEPAIQQVGFQPGEEDGGLPEGGPGDRQGEDGFHGGFPDGDFPDGDFPDGDFPDGDFDDFDEDADTGSDT